MNPGLATAATLSALLIAACAMTPSAPPAPAPQELAAASIRAEDLMRHIQILASDEFEGRLPGTMGEERTVAYLVEQFKNLGLKPGNPDGSYVQAVPLVGIDGQPSFNLKAGGRSIPLKYRQDYVAVTARFEPQVRVQKSELVFVGYGVQAPEYGWDDYKGLDVRGKTLVMLINDPAVPDPADAGQLDAALFKGRAMTYYGRWTYKYEIASKLGAAAAIIVHETGPAGYPWSVVESSWHGEQFERAAADRNKSRVPVQGWITTDKARELFQAAGADFDTLRARATARDFQPVPLKASADFTIQNRIREVQSRNVVALLPGAEPTYSDQYLIYSAHWDHLGRDETLPGDQIYNGAVDNASGIAGLLELAEAFTQLAPGARRSVLFLAVTAEEQGLLGSQQYASTPLYPLQRTLAMFNMDALNPWGPTRDIQVIGMGQSTLEDLLETEAAARGRAAVPDAEPEKGFYYRSDQFNFAKVGVPALYADGGAEVLGKPWGWGQRMRDAYTAQDYHKPSDEIKPGWDLSGAAEDMRLLFRVGYRVANEHPWPQWKAGSEFKAIREASLSTP